MNEKIKPIRVKYNDSEYTLDFTKASIKRMEERGFVYSAMDEKPVTMIPLFIHGAFFAKHPFVSEEQAIEIYASIPEDTTDAFVARLVELYNQAASSVFEKKKEGNATWE